MKKRIDKRKEMLLDLMANKPEAKLVENRYRAIRYVIARYFPELLEIYPPEKIEEIIKDAVYLDRQVRLATEDEDKEKKKILSQEYQVNELGRVPGFERDVKQLAKIR